MIAPPPLRDRRIWLMGAYGFASGLPLPLSGFTLGQWLTENGLSLHAIGLAALIGFAYSLKFLWSPALDHIAPPGLLRRLGRRRGWLALVQSLLVLSIAALALSSPGRAPFVTVGIAATMAFLSATQDIVIDAWRIETFGPHRQGPPLAAYVWGYRFALLCANPGVLWMAGIIGWHGALLAMAALGGVGLIVTALAPEPKIVLPPGSVRTGFTRAVVDPLKELLSRRFVLPALVFVALFNLGEALAGVMLPPYYRALGYVRDDVALANLPSLFAVLAGITIGGWLVNRIGTMRALVLTGFIQTGAILIYLGLGYAHGSTPALVGTVATEAFVGGLANAAFLAYLSSLCAPAHTATQYALLSSLSALPLRTVAGLSGFMAEAVGWHSFYALCTLAALPAMLIMVWLLRRQGVDPTRAPA